MTLAREERTNGIRVNVVAPETNCTDDVDAIAAFRIDAEGLDEHHELVDSALEDIELAREIDAVLPVHFDVVGDRKNGGDIAELVDQSRRELADCGEALAVVALHFDLTVADRPTRAALLLELA